MYTLHQGLNFVPVVVVYKCKLDANYITNIESNYAVAQIELDKGIVLGDDMTPCRLTCRRASLIIIAVSVACLKINFNESFLLFLISVVLYFMGSRN